MTEQKSREGMSLGPYKRVKNWLTKPGGGTLDLNWFGSQGEDVLEEILEAYATGQKTAQPAEDGLREALEKIANGEGWDKGNRIAYVEWAEKIAKEALAKIALAHAPKVAEASVPAPQTSAETYIICVCREGSSLPEGQHFVGCPLHAVPMARKAVERDYTPEEALAEARRRWPDNLIRISAELDSTGQNEKFLKEKGRRIEVVGNGRWNKSIFYGDTFRAAFASADKALENPKTGC